MGLSLATRAKGGTAGKALVFSDDLFKTLTFPEVAPSDTNPDRSIGKKQRQNPLVYGILAMEIVNNSRKDLYNSHLLTR